MSSTGSLAISGPNDSTPVSIGSASYGTGSGATTWSTATEANITDLMTALEGNSDLSGQLGTISVVDSGPVWS